MSITVPASASDRLERTSRADTVYWWFFGIYATVCVVWLILATTTLFWHSLFPTSMQMHAGGDLQEHGEDLLLSFGTLALGLFLAWLAPQNRTARAFAVGLVGTAVGFSLTAHHLLEAIDPSAMERLTFSTVPILHVVFHLIAGVSYTYALLLFPDGRLPPVSRTTLAVVGVALVGTLLVLVVKGHEPSFFILYCGIAVVVAGWFSQWQKSRGSPTAADRDRSRDFLHAFSLAIALAVALVAVEWALKWGALLGSHGTAPVDRLTDIVFVSVPPLLAGAGLVVFFGILQHRLWGVGGINKPHLFRVLITMVMGVFVVAEVVLHTLVERLGERVGASVTVSVVIAVVLGLAVLERPREWLKEGCNRLVYGTSRDPYELMSEFSEELAISVADGAVVPALARVLNKGLGVQRGVLAVEMGNESTRSIEWPPAATVDAEWTPLRRDDEDLGGVKVDRQERQALPPAEERLLTDLAVEAALAIRARTGQPVARTPAAPAPGGRGFGSRGSGLQVRHPRRVSDERLDP